MGSTIWHEQVVVSQLTKLTAASNLYRNFCVKLTDVDGTGMSVTTDWLNFRKALPS